MDFPRYTRCMRTMCYSVMYQLSDLPSSEVCKCTEVPTWQDKLRSVIKNTQDFVKFIQNIDLQLTEVMVTFDIKSIFTTVSIQEAFELVHETLLADESLKERTTLSTDPVTLLLDLCLRTTYFIYKRGYYQQKDGAAMGLKVERCIQLLVRSLICWSLTPSKLIQYNNSFCITWILTWMTTLNKSS